MVDFVELASLGYRLYFNVFLIVVNHVDFIFSIYLIINNLKENYLVPPAHQTFSV